MSLICLKLISTTGKTFKIILRHHFTRNHKANTITRLTNERESMSLPSIKYSHSIFIVLFYLNSADARFQQSRMELQYMIDGVMKQRYDDGSVPKRRG